MAKRLILFALRLLLLSVVAGILRGFFIAVGSNVVQICIEAVLALVLWVFVWNESVTKGFDHVKKDKNVQKSVEAEKADATQQKGFYVPWFGFAAGALSQLPALLLLIVYVIIDNKMQTIWYFVLNFSYFNFYTIAQSLKGIYPLLFILISLIMTIIPGFAYLNGPAKQRQLETIIERNKTKKAKRVQDEIVSKKLQKAARRK